MVVSLAGPAVEDPGRVRMKLDWVSVAFPGGLDPTAAFGGLPRRLFVGVVTFLAFADPDDRGRDEETEGWGGGALDGWS